MNTKDKFLSTLISCIKYPFDRKRIKKEYEQHIDEKIHDFMTEGYDESVAENMAIDRMGDPLEIGKQLNAVHSPVLGWLYVASKYTLVLLVFFMIFPMIGEVWDLMKSYQFDPEIKLSEQIKPEEIQERGLLDNEFLIDNTRLHFDEYIHTKDDILVLFFHASKISNTNLNFYSFNYATTEAILLDGQRVSSDSIFVEFPGIPDEGLNIIKSCESFYTSQSYRNDRTLIITNVSKVPNELKIILDNVENDSQVFEFKLKGGSQ